jgi:transcriptional regulator with XRE-family HTH domain
MVPKDDVTRFGPYLGQLIVAKGFTQREFAERLGIHEGTLANIKLGKRPCPKDQINPMIAALGLTGQEAEHFKLLAKVSWLDEGTEEYIIRKMTPPTSDSSVERRSNKGPPKDEK